MIELKFPQIMITYQHKGQDKMEIEDEVLIQIPDKKQAKKVVKVLSEYVWYLRTNKINQE